MVSGISAKTCLIFKLWLIWTVEKSKEDDIKRWSLSKSSPRNQWNRKDCTRRWDAQGKRHGYLRCAHEPEPRFFAVSVWKENIFLFRKIVSLLNKLITKLNSRDDFNVSCAELDELVELARATNGGKWIIKFSLKLSRKTILISKWICFAQCWAAVWPVEVSAAALSLSLDTTTLPNSFRILKYINALFYFMHIYMLIKSALKNSKVFFFKGQL